jgi:hypothetical protein
MLIPVLVKRVLAHSPMKSTRQKLEEFSIKHRLGPDVMSNPLNRLSPVGYIDEFHSLMLVYSNVMDTVCSSLNETTTSANAMFFAHIIPEVAEQFHGDLNFALEGVLYNQIYSMTHFDFLQPDLVSVDVRKIFESQPVDTPDSTLDDLWDKFLAEGDTVVDRPLPGAADQSHLPLLDRIRAFTTIEHITDCSSAAQALNIFLSDKAMDSLSNDDQRAISNWTYLDGLLFYQISIADGFRIFIPTVTLRSQIIYTLHDSSLHANVRLITPQITSRFYWPKMVKYIIQWHKGCIACNMINRRHTKPAGLLHSIKPETGRWTAINVDCVYAYFQLLTYTPLGGIFGISHRAI